MEQTDHSGHRERLRARFREEGMGGFAPHEALELLLTFAIPRVNTNPIAHRLLDRFGSLDAVLEARPEEIEQVAGIGPSASTLIAMLLPLFRVYQQQKSLPRRKIGTYDELAAYCRSLFLGAGSEQFYLLALDAKLHLLSSRLLSSGNPAEVGVSPRRIVQELIQQNATGAVIAHNHPSGSARPSQEDVNLTQDLYVMLQGMGIRLYDHVIIAGSEDFSFFHAGFLGQASAAVSQDQPLAADRPQRTLPARSAKR